MFHAIQRRIVSPIKALFTQGLTPHAIALCITLGAGISVFPLVGTTTLLCTLAAVRFRLNLPGIQAVNWALSGLQLALLIPFMRLGEHVMGDPSLPLTAAELAARLRAGPVEFLLTFWRSILHAVAGWAVVCVPAGALLYAVVRAAAAAAAAAARRRPPADLSADGA